MGQGEQWGPGTVTVAVSPGRGNGPEVRYSPRLDVSSRRDSAIASIRSTTRCVLAGLCLSPMKS